LLEESLALFREQDEIRGMALALTNLGQVAGEEGDHGRAVNCFKEALERFREVGDRRGMAECLEGLAIAYGGGAGAPGSAEHAARLTGAAVALREATGSGLAPIDRAHLERMEAAARVLLGDAGWLAAWAEGRAMTPEQVM